MDSPITPIRQRIAQALADVELRNRHLQPQAAYGQPQTGGAVPMPPQRPSIPLPMARPSIPAMPQQAQPMMQGQPGQPLNIAPGNAETMNFAGAKGPQWTDAEFQNFWNRVGSNG